MCQLKLATKSLPFLFCFFFWEEHHPKFLLFKKLEPKVQVPVSQPEDEGVTPSALQVLTRESALSHSSTQEQRSNPWRGKRPPAYLKD